MYVSGPTYWIGDAARRVGFVPAGCGEASAVVDFTWSSGVEADSGGAWASAYRPQAKHDSKQLAAVTNSHRKQHAIALGRFDRSVGAGSMIRMAVGNGRTRRIQAQKRCQVDDLSREPILNCCCTDSILPWRIVRRNRAITASNARNY
jgi:hypothetical protein